MKRFLLFGCVCYYPNGGASDLIGCFDSLEECKTHAFGAFKGQDWYDILDTKNGIVYHSAPGRKWRETSAEEIYKEYEKLLCLKIL